MSTHTHSGIPEFRNSGIPEFPNSNLQKHVCLDSGNIWFRNSQTQIFRNMFGWNICLNKGCAIQLYLNHKDAWRASGWFICASNLFKNIFLPDTIALERLHAVLRHRIACLTFTWHDHDHSIIRCTNLLRLTAAIVKFAALQFLLQGRRVSAVLKSHLPASHGLCARGKDEPLLYSSWAENMMYRHEAALYRCSIAPWDPIGLPFATLAHQYPCPHTPHLPTCSRTR